jgi:hypothetical protein
MSEGNSGVQLLKFLVKIAIFILKLIPGLIKLIIKGIKAIINMFRKKKSVPNIEPTES